jgi:hypothetical protein
MTVKNILKKIAAILGLNIDLDAADATENKDAALLIKCLDLVCGEIAAEYFPSVYEEDISFNGKGFAVYSAFSKPPLYVVSLRRNGQNVKYTAFADSIYAENIANMRLTVRYAYAHEEISGLTSRIALNPAITERILVMGTIAEYCLINGMFNENVMYDARYRESLRATVRKKSELKIKPQKWIK